MDYVTQATEDRVQRTEDREQMTEDGIPAADIPAIDNPATESVSEPVIDDTAVGAEPSGAHPNDVEPVGATSDVTPDATVTLTPAEDLPVFDTPPELTSMPVEQHPVPTETETVDVLAMAAAVNPMKAATDVINGDGSGAMVTGAISLEEKIIEAREKTGGE